MHKAPEVLSAAAGIAGGTHAYADIIRFENPRGGDDYLEWARAPSGVGIVLDIALPRHEQLGNPSARTSFEPLGIFSGPSQVAAIGTRGHTEDLSFGGYLLPVEGSSLIDGALSWEGTFSGASIAYRYYSGDPPGDFEEFSFIPKNVQTYLAVRFRIQDEDYRNTAGSRSVAKT